MDTGVTTTDRVGLSSELDAFLAGRERADSWRVERVLKESSFETTEVVWFRGVNGGELGPFIRKQIDCSAGVGSAYEELWRAQRTGIIFSAVPRLVECQRIGDKLLVVMEYIQGETLRDFVQLKGASIELVRAIIPALCDGVEELHTRLSVPLIHRDLKPSNVIVRDGRPIIIDFGIARLWHEGAEADTVHFGTKAYAPPEQFGFGQTDARSDVYALGKLLYFCLVGSDAPASCGAEELADAGISHSLADVILHATAFDPAERYASASDMKAAFFFALAPRHSEGFSAASHKVPVSGTSAYGWAAEQSDSAGALNTGKGQSSAEVHVDDASFKPDWNVPSNSDFSYRAQKKSGEDGRRADASAAYDEARAGSATNQSLAERIKSLLHRVPTWIGRVWNCVVLFTYGLFFVAAISAIVFPNENDRLLPPWFVAFEYTVLIIIGFLPLAYVLLDKRRLRAAFPWLPHASFLVELAVCVGASFACILIVMLVGALTGTI